METFQGNYIRVVPLMSGQVAYVRGQNFVSARTIIFL